MKNIVVLASAVCLASACAPTETESIQNEATQQSADISALSRDDSAFISRQGGDLYLQNSKVSFVGVNRYELAGGPLAATCMHTTDAAAWAAYEDDFIAQAANTGARFIRLWAFQNFAGPSGTDFSAFDKVVASARKYNVHLILTLENNWADCTQPTSAPKDDNWFGGGYKSNYGYPLNFVDYTRAIVNHFKDEPQIAMWQILNEGKWYQNPSVLQQFFVDTSNLIRSIDSQHLISSGGAIQCWQGAQGAADFQSFYDAPNIDVLDAHDYGDETQAWPDCMQAAWQAAQNLNKPFMIGESGVSTDQFNAQDRAQKFQNKLQQAATKGTAAYLIWSLNTHANYHDGFDFFPGDETAGVLQNAANQWYQSTPAAPAPAPTQPPAPAPTPTPTQPPAPTPTPTQPPAPAPTPAQDAALGCTVSATKGDTWQVGNNSYQGVLNLTITNTGNATLPVPWAVSVSVDGLTSLSSAWNWDLNSQSDGQATGTVSAAWAALQAKGGNSVGIGAVAALSNNALTVQSVRINDTPCTVVQAR